MNRRRIVLWLLVALLLCLVPVQLPTGAPMTLDQPMFTEYQYAPDAAMFADKHHDRLLLSWIAAFGLLYTFLWLRRLLTRGRLLLASRIPVLKHRLHLIPVYFQSKYTNKYSFHA